MVGDGRTTDFFHNSWISDLSLSLWLTFVNMEIESFSTIVDLLRLERDGWQSGHVA